MVAATTLVLVAGFMGMASCGKKRDFVDGAEAGAAGHEAGAGGSAGNAGGGGRSGASSGGSGGISSGGSSGISSGGSGNAAGAEPVGPSCANT